MNKKTLIRIFAVFLLLMIDLLLIPMSSYIDSNNLISFWVLIPFEIIHIVPFLIWMGVFGE